MKTVHMIAFILLAIGGLNWLAVGLVGWDLGSLFGGQGALVSRIIYILVGLSAVYEIFTHRGNCKTCSGGSSSGGSMGGGQNAGMEG